MRILAEGVRRISARTDRTDLGCDAAGSAAAPVELIAPAAAGLEPAAGPATASSNRPVVRILVAAGAGLAKARPSEHASNATGRIGAFLWTEVTNIVWFLLLSLVDAALSGSEG
ncbi:MAG TPA: hypothetical protein VM599_10685 [Thermoanaerobaculia bacterium]|nr:hypothetical protein [Thermoanaerobaculia bacterium]